MQSDVADSGLPKKVLPVLRVRAVVDGLARWGGEDPSALLPELTGVITFPFLLGTVLTEQLDERSRESDNAPSCPRLGLGDEAVQVAALRARPRTPAT
jgi:hypothetical protein